MREGNYINSNLLNFSNENLKNIKLKFYGLNNQTQKLCQRTEIFEFQDYKQYKIYNWLALLHNLSLLFPYSKNTYTKLNLNIFFLDVLNTYRGWRHTQGLPVRGQRTWTNAWSAYRSNLLLKNFKINILKKLYGNLNLGEINLIYLAEQLNLFWKLQWEHEWREAKKKRLLQKNNNFVTQKIDLQAMSKNIVWGYSKSGSKKSTKKSINKKNYFTLGFDPGFTKALIKANLISSSNKKK